MIFGSDRNELRRMYHDAWRKRRDGEPLSPLDTQIADVVAEHPEYHDTIEAEDTGKDYFPEQGTPNPYLHMGLHLGLREQLATNRPAGIRAVFDALSHRQGDPHSAEHLMIECLAETLWEAQRNGTPPDELRYLDKLRKL